MSASSSTSPSWSQKHDAVVLAGGAEKPRDLPIPGRELDGIHFAMEFLPQQNRRVGDEPLGNVLPILADGKHVVVIGGGDTGSDCIGTSNRQGAISVTQIEILQRPPDKENKELTWPDWPMKFRTSSSQEEGVERDFAVMTQRFEGKDGKVTALHCVRVDEQMKPIEGTEFVIKADLVLLAMGFLGPVQDGMVKDLGLDLDQRGNVLANVHDYQGERRQGVLLRRHAPRPEPRRLGDPRGPPVRPRRRQAPDGRDDAAAIGSAVARCRSRVAPARSSSASTPRSGIAAMKTRHSAEYYPRMHQGLPTSRGCMLGVRRADDVD